MAGVERVQHPAEPGFGVGHDRRELHDAGTTIVVITHDQHIGAAMPQRVGCAMAGSSSAPAHPPGHRRSHNNTTT
jgi:hypothetical protein